MLLESGRFLSNVGSASSAIAYPLLVYALTHSAVKMGIVAFVRGVPAPLLSLLAGVAADRGDRKRQMIAADVVRAAAVGALGMLVLLHHARWWVIPVVAVVEAIGSTLFSAAGAGALRAASRSSSYPRRSAPAPAARH